jgi:hypothetical protein
MREISVQFLKYLLLFKQHMLAQPLRNTSYAFAFFPSIFLSAGNVVKIKNIEFLHSIMHTKTMETEFNAEGGPINVILSEEDQLNAGKVPLQPNVEHMYSIIKAATSELRVNAEGGPL